MRLELDVLAAIEAVQALAEVRCGAIEAWIDPAAFVGLLWAGDTLMEVSDPSLALVHALHPSRSSYAPLSWRRKVHYKGCPLSPFGNRRRHV